MDDMMKIRVRSNDKAAWRICVEDAETGRHLPFMLNEDAIIRVRDGVVVLNGDLMVSELDVVALLNSERDQAAVEYLRTITGEPTGHESRPVLPCSDGEYEERP